MINLNNYILEKLKINKDTTADNCRGIIIDICRIEDNKEAQKVITNILEKLKINNIDDLLVSSWHSYDDLKPWFNNLKPYFKECDEKLYVKIIRNDNSHAKEVYMSEDKRLHILEFNLNYKKIIGFSVSYHEFGKTHTLYFIDDRD